MSLHTLVRELLDDDHDIDDASDIPTDMRPQLIRAWRETASPVEVAEAYLAGEDDADMSTLLAFALDEVLTHEGQQAMLRCFWAGMSWRVDKAIMEVKAEHELTALIAKAKQAEQQAEWNRDRYVDAKEFAA